jgi:hypothetical protein
MRGSKAIKRSYSPSKTVVSTPCGHWKLTLPLWNVKLVVLWSWNLEVALGWPDLVVAEQTLRCDKVCLWRLWPWLVDWARPCLERGATKLGGVEGRATGNIEHFLGPAAAAFAFEGGGFLRQTQWPAMFIHFPQLCYITVAIGGVWGCCNIVGGWI